MKANQKRFQEALKRLDREVHNKASLGMYGRRNLSSSQRKLQPVDDFTTTTPQQTANIPETMTMNKTLLKFQGQQDIKSTINYQTDLSPTTKVIRNSTINPSEIIESDIEFKPKPPDTVYDRLNRPARRNFQDKNFELFKSANPQLLESMLSIPKNAPLTAHPQEIGPILNWNDRSILDYGKIEQQLIKKTFELHQLVTQTFETRIDDSQSLPLDFFDCYNDAPEAELKLRQIDEFGNPLNKTRRITYLDEILSNDTTSTKFNTLQSSEISTENQFVAHGCTKQKYGTEYEWVPCTIESFHPDSFTFTIKLDNKFSIFDNTKQVTKDVTRFNLHFDGEDLEKLTNRFKMADKLRSEYEQNLRTITFLDTIKNINHILDFMPTDLLNRLPEDCKQEILRTQKMQIIRGSLKLESDPQLEKLMTDLNININAYSPLPLNSPFILPQTNFSAVFEKINKLFISSSNFVQLTQEFHMIYEKYFQSIKYLMNDIFLNKLLTINEWENLKLEFHNKYKELMFDFIDEIVQTIRMKMADLLDDDPTSEFKHIKDRPYLQFFVSNEKSLFNRLKRLTKLILIQFVYDVFSFNFTFFNDLITIQNFELKFEKKKLNEFETVYLDEDYITSQKPFIIIDLNSTKDNTNKILNGLFNVSFDVLMNLMNPFLCLFEQSQSRSLINLQHSKYESFLLAENLSSFMPSLLIFQNNQQIHEYFEQLSTKFCENLSLSIEKCFQDFEMIQNISQQQKDLFTFTTIPSFSNVLSELHLIKTNLTFFQKNFPMFINLGIFQLELKSFKEKNFVNYSNYRDECCQKVSNEFVELMVNLNKDYADISKKLKMEIQTAEQWITVQDILDQIHEKRIELEKTQETIEFLYNLLIDLFYGIENNHLVLYLNTTMWPILIDMELGQSIAHSKKLRDVYKEQIPVTISQLQNEIEKLNETISRSNKNEVDKFKNYQNHLKQRIDRYNEIITKLSTTTYDKFNQPRVKLWCIVTLSQESIASWQSIHIQKIDFTKIKDEIDNYLKQLRLLTRSFKDDSNSLRLLISTKNDLEQLNPIFKAIAQLLSLQDKERSKKEIENLFGQTNYQQMTLEEIQPILSSITPEINKIYQKSKNEDKTDIELINCESTIMSLKIAYKDKQIQSINGLLKTIRELKTCLNNLQSIEDVKKQNDVKKMLSHVRQMNEILDLLSIIQKLIFVLEPLKTVSLLSSMSTKITSLLTTFSDQMKELENSNTLLVKYSSLNNLIQLKNIRSQSKEIYSNVINKISEMRNKNARLLLVPDQQIINIFNENFLIKMELLKTTFPGIKEFIFQEMKLTSLKLFTNDCLNLVNEIDLNNPLFCLIEELTDTIQHSMKHCFFNSSDFETMPLQLCFLKLIQNPEITINLQNEIKNKQLNLFKQSLLNSKKKINLEICEEDVYLICNEHKIKYGFQISKCESYLLSPDFFDVLFDLIAFNNNKPILVHSQSYLISSLVIELFSFITGRFNFIIHPTLSTPINQLPLIIELLSKIDLNLTITEIELFSMKQLFELSMLINRPYFCSLTSNSVPSIIQSGKQSFYLNQNVFYNHLKFISSFLDQSKSEFIVETLSKYLHIDLCLNYLEKFFYSNQFDLSFVQNIQMVIPPEVFESIDLTLPDTISKTQKKFVFNKVILSTQDFVQGVEMLSEQFNQGIKMMLVIGPPFSGITTCISSAASNCNLNFISLAFSSSNWIVSLFEVIEEIDDKPTVLHVLLPFDKSFSGHSSSLLINSLIIQNKSFLCLKDNCYLVFEMMNSIENALTIPIPIFTFSNPLIKSSELLLYKMVNSEFLITYDDREYIRSVTNQLIDSSHQLQIFYMLFSSLYQKFTENDSAALSLMVSYCIFWSRTFLFNDLNEWIKYSDLIKDVTQIKLKNIFEYMYDDKKLSFELSEIYQNKNCVSIDESIIFTYSELHCGNVCNTNIPTIQFINCIQQLPCLIQNEHSVMLIGDKGTGKSTIVNYITMRYFKEPDYIILNFDGNSISEDELLDQILAVSVITVDNIIQPQNNSICIINVDPFSPSSSIYGCLLSISKTGNCIIKNKILMFKRFRFFFVLEQYDYQLTTCCYPISIKPYTVNDLYFISKELLTRILLKRFFSSSQISYFIGNLFAINEFLFDVLKNKNLHFFFNLFRTIDNITGVLLLDLFDFFKWKLNLNSKLKYEFVIPNKNSNMQKTDENRAFVYTPKQQTSKFESSITPFVHLFLYNININKDSLDYINFVIDVVLTQNQHAMIVNDLHHDYEMLTQFAASTLSASFVIFNSLEQLSSIILNSINSPQPIILFCRKPIKELINLIKRGFKTTDIYLINSLLTDSSIIEKLDLLMNNCQFPYANFIFDKNNESKKLSNVTNETITPELSRIQSITHRIKPSTYYFFQFHFFRTVHVFFSIQNQSELIDLDNINKWDRSDKIPETDNELMSNLFDLLMRHKEKCYVKMIHQLPKIIQKYDFLLQLTKKFIEKRHMFVQQILVVIKSIEQSIVDTDELIQSTKRQIEMDEVFHQTHSQAVQYRQTIVTDLTGELTRNKSELDIINNKCNEYNEYKQKDSSNTSQLVDQATKNVVKSFTQEEQYKLYIQQNPSQAVRHLFNTYCILREFTPREENDYWPEARVLLKSGRFHRTITVFDKNNIKKNVILQFDVMMNSPLIKEENFPPNSACRALAQWIRAVHKHTQSTTFNSTVSQEMLELMKSKSRKEKEIEEIEKRLKVANEDLKKHEQSLNELQQKIQNENLLLMKIVKYNETAKTVSNSFEFIKDELTKFSEGELNKGQNLPSYTFYITCLKFVLTMFSQINQKIIEKDIHDLLNDGGYDYSYFITLKDICGSDDPVVLSILSGDRLIAVYDPNDYTFDLLSESIPALSEFEFIFTDPYNSKTSQTIRSITALNTNNAFIQKENSTNINFYSIGFIEDVIRAAEEGKILVIRHGDSVLSNSFLNSIASLTVKSGRFLGKVVQINPEFRVIFLLDKAPFSMNSKTNLNPYTNFIAVEQICREKVQSVLIDDETPLKLQKKLQQTELLYQAQKENLYQSIQKLNDELQRIHGSDSDCLSDLLLQTQLFENVIQSLKENQSRKEHSLDGFENIYELSDDVIKFIYKLQNMYKVSPLYIFPFSKIQIELNRSNKFAKSESLTKSQMIDNFHSNISKEILNCHLYQIGDIQPHSEIEISSEKILIFHYTDIGNATNFFLSQKVPYVETINISIDKNSQIESIEEKLHNVLNEVEKSYRIIFSFFEENLEVANLINKLLIDLPSSKWNERTVLYVVTDNSFEFPPYSIISSKLIALE